MGFMLASIVGIGVIFWIISLVGYPCLRVVAAVVFWAERLHFGSKEHHVNHTLGERLARYCHLD